MKLLKMAILTLAFTISMCVSSDAGWLIYHKPEFKGKVIDAQTKAPIQGVVVVVVYEKIEAGLGPDWSAFPFDAKEAVTDSTGQFKIPSYTTFIQPFSFGGHVKFIIYKPGYGNQSFRFGSANEEERFFSEDFGKEREIELWVLEGKSAQKQKFTITFGLVNLPRLETREERLNRRRDISVDPKLRNKTPILNRVLYDEDEALGFKHN